MLNQERNQMRAPESKRAKQRPVPAAEMAEATEQPEVSEQLAKLAAMDLKSLSRSMKELRASLFLAGSEARGQSGEERLAVGLQRLRERVPQRAQMLEDQLMEYNFADQFEHLNDEFDKLKNAPPANREKKAEPTTEEVTEKIHAETVGKWKKEEDEKEAKRVKSERAEYVAPTELKSAAKPKRGPEARVIIPEQEVEAMENVESLRKKIEEGSAGVSPERMFEDLAARARRQVSLAESVRKEFLDALKRGNVSDETMNRYDNQLMAFRNQLEDLQGQSRLVPVGVDRGQVESLRNDVYSSLQNIEEAMRIAELPPDQAKYEAKFGGVRQREIELEERGAKAGSAAELIKEEITNKYGASPEALMSGEGLTGTWFRLKNSLSRLVGQESEYDKWQKAVEAQEAGEAAKGERTFHERKGEFDSGREEREKKKRVAEQVAAEKRSIKEAALQEQRLQVGETLGRQRATEMYYDIASRMQMMKSENPDGYAFTSEGYVTNLANLSKAIQNDQKAEIKEYTKSLQDWNEELGYPKDFNPLFGAGASRLKQARAIGGGRAREGMAQEAGRAAGSMPRKELNRRVEVTPVEAPVVTLQEVENQKYAAEDAQILAYESKIRQNPGSAVKELPNAAALWEGLTSAIKNQNSNNLAVPLEKMKLLSEQEISQSATELVLNLALYRQAIKADNIRLAERYQGAVNEILKHYALDKAIPQKNKEDIKALQGVKEVLNSVTANEDEEPEKPTGPRTMSAKQGMAGVARRNAAVGRSNARWKT